MLSYLSLFPQTLLKDLMPPFPFICTEFMWKVYLRDESKWEFTALMATQKCQGVKNGKFQ